VAERARANLARYFSPNLVDLLADRDEPLGPVRRETVAVLFADIVGFTRMAERMAPEAVVTMLREFQERMTAEIFACGGTVEKYIGDAILAVFGLLHASAQDAARAFSG
jgi:adenylate cyclase